MASFADRLREEIEYLGLTQKELAYRAEIKPRALAMYLGSQNSMPPADVAVRLAKVLNVTVEYLVTGEKSSSIKAHDSPRPKFEQDLEKCSEQARQFLETAIHLFAVNKK